MNRYTPGDLETVYKIFSDKSVLPYVTDDGDPNGLSLKKNLLAALHNVNVYFLKPRVGAVIMFIPTNHILYDVHFAVMAGPGRKYAGKDAYRSLVWMAEHTDAKKFTTMVPGFNRAATLFARRCGMVKEGVFSKAYLKDGNLYDIDLYGVTDDQLLGMRR